MTNFSDLLQSETVIEGVAAKAKKQLFQQIAAVAAKTEMLDADMVAARLADRERIGSTGFGGGIAIPHAKIDGLDHVVGVFARLATPIEFQSIDGLPVDLVFAMLSPPDRGGEHLKTLARVSRQLRDRAFVAKLRGAGSSDALYALWTADEARDAA